jgi:hypothetical protein
MSQGGGAEAGGGAGAGGDQMIGDGQRTTATSSVLVQIARMTGRGSADDLVSVADMALSKLYMVDRQAYKDFLIRLRVSAAKPPKQPKDIIGAGNKDTGTMPPKAGVGGAVAGTGMSDTTTSAPPLATGTGGTKESRRVFGGKYIRESAVDKMHREFQQHLLNLK